MIFSWHVKRIAQAEVHRVLGTLPGVEKDVLNPRLFDRWVRLCTARCNQLDMMKCISGKPALEKFIRDAVRVYADKVLQKLGNRPTPVGANKQDFEGLN